jgi:16S rRNA (cytosine967-C5)-methyltransferase
LPTNTLICIEPVAARARLVEAAVDTKSASVVIADGTTYKPSEAIGVILVDAPCSGLGSLRRKPESRWLKAESEISPLRVLQLKLLANAAKMLGDGGFIVYSTCTPVLSETNSVVAEFLESHSNFELEDATGLLSQIAPSLDLPGGRRTIQLWTGQHGTDDMFMAVLRKKGEVAN